MSEVVRRSPETAPMEGSYGLLLIDEMRVKEGNISI